ncbi:MAG: hypothetical protein GXX78_16820 [Bacteroidales bacterium]|nr:hypothetical protein [Bacteroidales bacterium]
MKKMKSIFFLLILITGCSIQESQKSEKNCINCETELILEDVKDLICKVAKFNDTTYILAYDSVSLVDLGYVVGSESILVPCGLPENLKIPETYLKVSGQIVKDCCNLLTLPQIRGGFGCKFYITEYQITK